MKRAFRRIALGAGTMRHGVRVRALDLVPSFAPLGPGPSFAHRRSHRSLTEAVAGIGCRTDTGRARRGHGRRRVVL